MPRSRGDNEIMQEKGVVAAKIIRIIRRLAVMPEVDGR
jgi:hypothetical protein